MILCCGFCSDRSCPLTVTPCEEVFLSRLTYFQYQTAMSPYFTSIPIFQSENNFSVTPFVSACKLKLKKKEKFLKSRSPNFFFFFSPVFFQNSGPFSTKLGLPWEKETNTFPSMHPVQIEILFLFLHTCTDSVQDLEAYATNLKQSPCLCTSVPPRPCLRASDDSFVWHLLYPNVWSVAFYLSCVRISNSTPYLFCTFSN